MSEKSNSTPIDVTRYFSAPSKDDNREQPWKQFINEEVNTEGENEPDLIKVRGRGGDPDSPGPHPDGPHPRPHLAG